MPKREQELEALEKRLGTTLRADYRHFLAHYPAEIAETDYLDGPGPSDFELLSSPQEIAELNENLRELWPESDYASVELPADYVFIGHDGCGNMYAVDNRHANGCPVFEFEHELGEWKQIASSLEEFSTQLLRMAAELRSRKP